MTLTAAVPAFRLYPCVKFEDPEKNHTHTNRTTYYRGNNNPIYSQMVLLALHFMYKKKLHLIQTRDDDECTCADPGESVTVLSSRLPSSIMALERCPLSRFSALRAGD